VNNIIENPNSGERIVIHKRATDTGGALMTFEQSLAPGYVRKWAEREN
jgi:hypothetical protein